VVKGISCLPEGTDIEIYSRILNDRFQTFLLRTKAKLMKIFSLLKRVARRDEKTYLCNEEYQALKNY
jgi:hypothetical protein